MQSSVDERQAYFTGGDTLFRMFKYYKTPDPLLRVRARPQLVDFNGERLSGISFVAFSSKIEAAECMALARRRGETAILDGNGRTVSVFTENTMKSGVNSNELLEIVEVDKHGNPV